jgi:hypothetical protein
LVWKLVGSGVEREWMVRTGEKRILKCRILPRKYWESPFARRRPQHAFREPWVAQGRERGKLKMEE